MKKFAMAAGGLFVLLSLAACQSQTNDDPTLTAAQASAGGDSTVQVAACTARMASNLGIRVTDVLTLSTQLNGDQSMTIGLQAPDGRQASCTADSQGNVMSYR